MAFPINYVESSSLGTDLIPSADANLINIGTGGLPGSQTVINIGSVFGGNTVINLSGTIVNNNSSVLISGPTSSRPSPTFVGQFYFDTTLGLPIWTSSLSGPIWVNAAGVQT
jgi:hypothetical protein